MSITSYCSSKDNQRAHQENNSNEDGDMMGAGSVSAYIFYQGSNLWNLVRKQQYNNQEEKVNNNTVPTHTNCLR